MQRPNDLLLRELKLERELSLREARTSFLAFCLYVTPSFKVHWHIRLICDAIDQLVRKPQTKLLVALPPQIGKSTLCSIHLPAFLLGYDSDKRILAASYAASLANSFNRQVQRLMETDAYREVFPNSLMRGSSDKADVGTLRTQSAFEISGRKGFLRSLGTMGAATGFSADLGICDDLIKNSLEADSYVYRERLWAWWQSTFVTRLQQDASLLVAGTSWHADDFLSRIQRENDGSWRVIKLPALAEGDLMPEDNRVQGEALWPERFTAETLMQRRQMLGTRQFNALYQQQPTPPGGQILKSEYWQHYTELPPSFDLLCISADLNFQRSSDSDFTVLLVVGRKGSNFYIVDMVRDRMGWLQQKRALKNLISRYPSVNTIYVEAAANGFALVEEARQAFSGVVAIKPQGSKETRCEAVVGIVEAGNVFLPHLKTGKAWGETIIDECAQFPAGKNDDIVDSLSMALAQMKQRAVSWDFTATSLKADGLSGRW